MTKGFFETDLIPTTTASESPLLALPTPSTLAYCCFCPYSASDLCTANNSLFISNHHQDLQPAIKAVLVLDLAGTAQQGEDHHSGAVGACPPNEVRTWIKVHEADSGQTSARPQGLGMSRP